MNSSNRVDPDRKRECDCDANGQQASSAFEIGGGFLPEGLEFLGDIFEDRVDGIGCGATCRVGGVIDLFHQGAYVHAPQPFHEFSRGQGRKVAAAPEPKCSLRIGRDLSGWRGRWRFRCHPHRRTVGAHSLDKALLGVLKQRLGRIPLRLRQGGIVDLRQRRWRDILGQYLIEHLLKHVFEPGFAH
ncbi:MAG: hypothetical protein WDO17_22155 [Alphaproteobacteria bacterium]